MTPSGSRSRSRLLISSLLVAPVLLAGCANGPFFVKKSDLNEVDSALSRQQAEIGSLKLLTMEQHQEALDHDIESTERILDAISEQVEKPSCPPAPKPAACVVNSENQNSSSPQRQENKLIVGQVERVLLAGPEFIYQARIDSGATTSSIDARNVERFERDGEDWVRFDIPVPSEDGSRAEEEELETLEREISRNANIIQASSEEAERRAVVKLQFSIGDHQQEAEFTLSNRENLEFPLLIGRNILRDVMLIDVGKELSANLSPEPFTDEDDDN